MQLPLTEDKSRRQAAAEKKLFEFRPYLA